MNENLVLLPGELELIVELLERERQELPPEIHHTDRPELHDELQARMKMVDRLLQRLGGQLRPNKAVADPGGG
jgi:hypothetical protein